MARLPPTKRAPAGAPRRRPFDTDYVIDRTINETDTLLYILELLDRTTGYDTLPTNWLIAFVVQKFGRHAKYTRDLLGDLTCARPSGPQKLLARFTFGGELSVGEVRKYYRTKAGDDYMADELRNRGRLPHRLHRPSVPHELFGSLVTASIELGMMRDGLVLAGPREIFSHSRMGEYKPKDPYTFELPGDRSYTHDNHPRVARYPKGAKLLIPEWDMNNEGIDKQYDSKTGKPKASMADHIEKIIEVLRRPKNDIPLFQKKYGIAEALSTIATTSVEHAKNIKIHVEQNHGPQEDILIKAFPQFANLKRTIPVTPEGWDGLWMRPGHPDFCLKTLSAGTRISSVMKETGYAALDKHAQ